MSCKVTLLARGGMNFAMEKFHASAKEGDRVDGANYAFVVDHLPSGKRVVYDLGIHSNSEVYTPMSRGQFPLFTPKSPAEPIDKVIYDFDRKPVDYVIFSHSHWYVIHNAG